MAGLKLSHTLMSGKPSGAVSLWRYTANTRHYRGWHLAADTTGCRSLLDLLDALTTGPDSYRTIPLRPPTEAQLAVPNHRGSPPLAATKLQLALSDMSAEWCFPSDHDPARLTIGSDWLAPLRNGVRDMVQGRGDYRIGNDANGNWPLWFWWNIPADRS